MASIVSIQVMVMQDNPFCDVMLPWEYHRVPDVVIQF